MRKTVFALALFALVPLTAHADNLVLSDVTVIVGSGVFKLWNFPVTLHGGESLVLTQTCPKANDTSCYSFDLSEYAHELLEDGPYQGTSPVIQFTANGVMTEFVDSAHALTSHDNDSGNEAKEFELVFKDEHTEWYVGYGDNVHKEKCGVPRCFPTGFFSPTYFQGAFAYRQVGTGEMWELDIDHCLYGSPSCLDGAGILIIDTDEPDGPPVIDHSPVPEPASLLLLGTGLLIVAGRFKKGAR